MRTDRELSSRRTPRSPGSPGRGSTTWSRPTVPASTSPSPVTARSSCCCTASRSSGGPGGTSCRPSPPPATGSPRWTCAASAPATSRPAATTRAPSPRTPSGVIRSLGDRDAVVVGQGLGGLVAWTLSVVHPRQVRRLVAVSMPHPRRLRRAHLTDAAAGRGPAGTCSATRRRCCRSAGWSPTTPRPSATLLRQWAGPGFPDAETEAPLPAGRADPRRRALRAGVLPLGGPLDPAHRRRPLRPPDGQPGHRAHPAGARRAGPLRAAVAARRAPAATSRRPTAGT